MACSVIAFRFRTDPLPRHRAGFWGENNFFMAENKTTPNPKKEWVDCIVTEQILADNPEMAEHGIKVGDTVQYTENEALYKDFI